jgi:hypothetical protein
MTTFYVIEADACFQPRSLTYAREANACDAIGGFTEALGSAWTDGQFWLDHDGVTLVGWIEADGSLFPSQDVLDGINA